LSLQPHFFTPFLGAFFILFGKKEKRKNRTGNTGGARAGVLGN
jgi:hypothetical protein